MIVCQTHIEVFNERWGLMGKLYNFLMYLPLCVYFFLLMFYLHGEWLYQNWAILTVDMFSKGMRIEKIPFIARARA